jgi:hypothetical protein
MITKEFLENLEFRVFDHTDYYGFAGVQSPVPLIAEFEDKYTIIIDGGVCQVYDDECNMVDDCEDICNL